MSVAAGLRAEGLLQACDDRLHVARLFGRRKAEGRHADAGEDLVPQRLPVAFRHPAVQILLRLAAVQHFEEGDKDGVVLDEQPVARQGDEVLLAVLPLGDEDFRERPGRFGGESASLSGELLEALRQFQRGSIFSAGTLRPSSMALKALFVHRESFLPDPRQEAVLDLLTVFRVTGQVAKQYIFFITDARCQQGNNHQRGQNRPVRPSANGEAR